jgi:hypothetical protein
MTPDQQMHPAHREQSWVVGSGHAVACHQVLVGERQH